MTLDEPTPAGRRVLRTVMAGAAVVAAAGVAAVLLPAVKAAGQLTAAVTIGWLMAAAWLVPPQRSRLLDVAGYRAVRAAVDLLIPPTRVFPRSA